MEPEDFKNFCNEIKNSVIISKNKVNKSNQQKKIHEKLLASINVIFLLFNECFQED